MGILYYHNQDRVYKQIFSAITIYKPGDLELEYFQNGTFTGSAGQW